MSIQEIERALRNVSLDEAQRLRRVLDERLGGTEKPPTLHDRAKHLIGPGSGLGDLASNPAHMEGYGEDSLA